MDKVKIIAKLEDDLSHFLIDETCKKDPSKRGSSELYKYRGISINTNDEARDVDKIMSVRIGALEAHFKIDTSDKVGGNLSPDDERAVRLWMAKIENNNQVKAIFTTAEERKKPIPIIPFDLEHIYFKN